MGGGERRSQRGLLRRTCFFSSLEAPTPSSVAHNPDGTSALWSARRLRVHLREEEGANETRRLLPLRNARVATTLFDERAARVKLAVNYVPKRKPFRTFPAWTENYSPQAYRLLSTN